MLSKAAQTFKKCNVLYGHRFAAKKIVSLDPLNGIRPLAGGEMPQRDGWLEASLRGRTSGTAKDTFDLRLERFKLWRSLNPDQKAVGIEALADIGLCERQIKGLPGQTGEGKVNFLHSVSVRDFPDEAKRDVVVLGRNPLHAGHGTAHQRQRFTDIDRKVECDKKSQEARFP